MLRHCLSPTKTSRIDAGSEKAAAGSGILAASSSYGWRDPKLVFSGRVLGWHMVEQIETPQQATGAGPFIQQRGMAVRKEEEQKAGGCSCLQCSDPYLEYR